MRRPIPKCQANALCSQTSTQHSRVGQANFPLSRLREPDPENDLALILLPDIDPVNGKKRPGFEQNEQIQREAKLRAQSLVKYGSKHALKLGTSLTQNRVAGELQSFASPVFNAEFRRRFLGETIRLVRTYHPGDVCLYTLASGKWKFHADELPKIRFKKLLEQLRLLLIRKGRIDKRSGWAIISVHNEYDSVTDTYQPHFHVIVFGDKQYAFEALRELEMFKGGKGKPVYRPIQRDELVDIPRQISYVLKGYWPADPSLDRSPTCTHHRSNHKMRIPEPRHAESLLFLDQQRFSDLVWLHGLVIRDGRLVPTSEM